MDVTISLSYLENPLDTCSLVGKCNEDIFATLNATNATCHTTFYFLILSKNDATIVHFQAISLVFVLTKHIILLIEKWYKFRLVYFIIIITFIGKQ